MKKDDKNHKKVIVIFITILLILDQITKIICYQKGIASTVSDNAEENNGYYIIMSIIIIIMILRYIGSNNLFIKLGTKIILSFAIAGAIGNMIDRMWNRNVIVFIKIANSTNINLAYIYIIIAWIGMAFILTKDSMRFLNDRKNKKLIKEEFEQNKDTEEDKD